MPARRDNTFGIQRSDSRLTEADIRAIVAEVIAGDAIPGSLSLSGDLSGNKIGPVLSAMINSGVIELDHFTGAVLSFFVAVNAPKFTGLVNAVDDAAAAAAGILVGSVYRNGSTLMIRVT